MKDKVESFSDDFAKLRSMGEQTFVLRGSSLIVEILPREEMKTAGGLVIATDTKHVGGQSVTAHAVEVGKVLMAGQGYWSGNGPFVFDEEEGVAGPTGQYEPLECQPGAIVLLPQYSIQLMSHFPGIQRPTGNKLAMIKMDQILAYYPTQQAYEAAKKELNHHG